MKDKGLDDVFLEDDDSEFFPEETDTDKKDQDMRNFKKEFGGVNDDDVKGGGMDIESNPPPPK